MVTVHRSTWRKVSRKTILIEQGGRCRYCFRPLKNGTLDHVKPQSMGGTDDNDNLVVACKPCNLAKGSMSINQFKKFIKKRGSIHCERRRIFLAGMRSEKRILRYVGLT